MTAKPATETRKYINASWRPIEINLGGRGHTLRPYNYRERFGGDVSNYILELAPDKAEWYVRSGALTLLDDNKGKVPDLNRPTTPEEELAKANAERASLQAAAEEQERKDAEAAKREAVAKAAEEEVAKREAAEAEEREAAAKLAKAERETEESRKEDKRPEEAERPVRRAPPPRR